MQEYFMLTKVNVKEKIKSYKQMATGKSPDARSLEDLSQPDIEEDDSLHMRLHTVEKKIGDY